jgi:DNA-binding IscR family transcriptional regulator
MLAVPAGTLTVGEVIRFIDGPQTPVRCLGEGGGADCRLLGSCAFADLWARAARAVAEVYEHTTLRDLVEQERASRGIPAYCI